MKVKKTQYTIHDVAKAAGVSVSTVSRVLNDKDDVSPATQEKVQKIIDELGYASNLAARSMRSRKNNVIGLIMPDVSAPFPIEVMKGVNRAIDELDYDLMIYTGGDYRKKTAASQEQYYVSLLNSGVTDGVIVVTPVAKKFTTANPIIAIDPNTSIPEYTSITSTNREGALEVMRHLTENGHSRIGFIGGREGLESAKRRMLGYKDGLAAAGISLDETLIENGDFTADTGKELGLKLLQLPTPPTAIFAANDQTAVGVLEAAAELNVNVPDDLSVVGFDNTPEAKMCNPPLTTVDQGVSEMGYLATQKLIQLINQEDDAGEIVKVATKLIVRQSVKPLD